MGGRDGGEGGDYTVEVRCQALRRTWGLIDHYFLVIGEHEYHMGGSYSKGAVLPIGTTKGAHTISIKTVCAACYTRTVDGYRLREDRRLFNFYPIVNCETLSTGLSLQAVSSLAVPFVIYLLSIGSILWAVILTLCTVVVFLASSKYAFSRTVRLKCRHL